MFAAAAPSKRAKRGRAQQVWMVDRISPDGDGEWSTQKVMSTAALAHDYVRTVRSVSVNVVWRIRRVELDRVLSDEPYALVKAMEEEEAIKSARFRVSSCEVQLVLASHAIEAAGKPKKSALRAEAMKAEALARAREALESERRRRTEALFGGWGGCADSELLTDVLGATEEA